MKKTHGDLLYSPKKDRWVIKGQPHIMIRFKRMFQKVHKKGSDSVSIANTDEVCTDIEWFMKRYPLKMSKEVRERLEGAARRHEEKILTMEEIVGSGKSKKSFEMALPPRDYQTVAADIMLRQGFLLLGDDVGLGKTCCTIATFTDPKTLPACVVTLAGSMPRQWAEEVEKFIPDLHVHVLRRATPYPLPKFFDKGPDVLVLNYHKLDGWQQVLASYCNSVTFDEVQELRTGNSAKCAAADNIARKMAFRFGLSATPIYNMGGEIYNLFKVLAPGRLGTKAEFQREWCSHSWDEATKKALPLKDPKAFGTYLREQFLMLRRTRQEVAREIPPVSKIRQHVDSAKEPLESVKDSAKELARIILGQSDADLERGAEMQASQELSWKLREATGVAKAPHVADFIRMLVQSGESVLVYLWHRAVYEILLKRLADLKPLMFTGSETPSQKYRAKQDFVEGKSKVLLMSLRAGAGIDGLQKVCRTVVFGELDWSPGVHEQGLGRVARDGQPDPVTAYFLVSDQGSDPVVAETLGLKREQVEGIRNPERDLLEKLESGADRTKQLARHYLKSLGHHVPEVKKSA